jgi:hypothetical protein
LAREAENQTLSSVLNVVPPESPVFYALLGQILENSSAKDKGLVQALIQQVIQGQAPGSAKDKEGAPDDIDQQRRVADLREVVARTRQKDAKTAETIVKIQTMGTGNGRDKRAS